MRKMLFLASISLAALLHAPVIVGSQTQGTTPQPVESSISVEPSWVVGTGKVKSFKPVDAQHWTIEIESPEALIGEKLVGDITLNLTNGLREKEIRPDPSWVGMTTIFEGLKRGATVGVVATFVNWSALSPDGEALFVWPKNPESDIKAIKRVISLYPIGSKESLSQVANMVEDQSLPLFLRKRIIGILRGLAEENDSLRSFNNQHFRRWRDLKSLPIELRLEADRQTALQFLAYILEANRRTFLNSIVNSPDATEGQKALAQARLKEIPVAVQ